MTQHAPDINRGLSNRQMQFIALGSTVGAGLFLGVGQGIRIAGPAMILTYLIAGALVLIVARCLGEMALAGDRPKIFVSYTRDYLGHRAALVQAWAYFACCLLICVAELTAAGLFVRTLFPSLPLWVSELTCLFALTIVNRLGTTAFGEIEFWLSLLKVVAIVSFLIGAGAVLLGLPPRQLEGAGIHNLWTNGGFFPNGVLSTLSALPVALFAFGGTELIGIAAAEARDPENSVPRATNGLILRLCLFFIGTTFALVCLEPWQTVPVESSPIAQVLTRIGFPAASVAMNVVLISAAISACNAMIYAGSRIFTAAITGMGSRDCQLSARWISRPAYLFSLAAVVSLGASAIIPQTVFGMMMGMAAVLGLVNWAMFLFAHLRYRATPAALQSSFRVPGAPWTVIAALLLIGLALILAVSTAELRIGSVLAICFVAALWLAFSWQAKSVETR